ncbi:MAG: NAD-dependent epimerase/dehydratase family protein [Gemmatimonadota bacterium]|nr:NAD-dependent epimerase/dehydratase family protein [Gemmatimonadota bacterium]
MSGALPSGGRGSAAATRLVAITGGGGFIGRAVEARLRGRVRLRGLFRGPSSLADAWRERGHEVVMGDLADEAALARLVEGAGAVIHLAARMRKDDPAASRAVNVEGTGRLARAAAAAGVARLVYVSSISVFAATRAPGRTVTEDLEPERIDRLNPYSATKYEGERVVRELAARGEGPPFVIVRPTNVFGPGGRSWFVDWASRLRRLPVVPGGDVDVDLVHVDDVAEALARAAEVPAAAGEVLHVGGGPVRLADYLVALGAEIGLRVRRLPAPLDLLARHAIERGHRVLKGEQMSTPLTRSLRVPSDKARRVLGYEPRVALAEGLRETARWYREEERADTKDRS